VLFHILNSLLLAVFRNMSNEWSWQQSVYMYKSISMGHIAVNMSVTGSLPVSCWFVCILSSLCNKLLLYFFCNWDETLSSLWCIVTNLRKNYPGSSIGRSTDSQAGVVVWNIAMVKWLLACLQMAISASTTGLPWTCFSWCSNIFKKFEDGFQQGWYFSGINQNSVFLFPKNCFGDRCKFDVKGGGLLHIFPQFIINHVTKNHL